MKFDLHNRPGECWMVLGTLLVLLSGCQSEVIQRESGTATIDQISPGLSIEEAATLSSLEQIDGFPLYSMFYEGEYSSKLDISTPEKDLDGPAWACSLFVSYEDPHEILFGRNFDWDFSPALLLFTDPPGGYKSVSMVDIHYLGYEGDLAYGLSELPLEERLGLLDAPTIPFDGVNEAGLAVGMAAVPPGNMETDPAKETIDSVMVIRKILDQAATVDEAVEIFNKYNIDMMGNYLHYLISERSGKSVLIEFSGGEMVVIPAERSWQAATNFLLSEEKDVPEVCCGRYAQISEKLTHAGGKITPRQAMRLLDDVSQPSTQWSVVYRLSADEVWIVMGTNYDQVYKIKLGFD